MNIFTFFVTFSTILFTRCDAKLRRAEDFRISIYNEITGLAMPLLTGGSASDGRPPSFSSRRATGVDPLGSQVMINYDIYPKEELVILDQHEGVLALDCEKANIFPSGTLELRVSSASAFLENLPEDALFSIGPGWGCNATNENGDVGTSGLPPSDSGLAALEPDGSSLYLRVLSIVSSAPSSGFEDTIVFEVTETSFQDLFIKADISFSRHLDSDDAQRFAAASKAALHAIENNTRSSGRRRLTWVEAYTNVRHNDDSEESSFTPGLTPHSRGLRRLHAATRELQGSFTYFNDADSDFFSRYCVLWWNACYWGFQYVYNYEVVNWNYDVDKASNCLSQRLNVQQCDRSVTKTIPLSGNVITCRSCFAYLGANLQFNLKFDRREIYSFLFKVYGGAVAAMDINVDFPNDDTSVSTTTMLNARRQVGSVTVTVGPVPLKIEFYSTISIELSARCASSGRIVGPGFWFENDVQVGRSYQKYGNIWTDLTSAQVHMNKRAPSLDIQVNAALKARLILDMEFNVKLMLIFSWPLHFILAPSLYADLTINTRCSSNMITIALYSQLEGKVKIEGPSLVIDTGSYGLGTYSLGRLFNTLEGPYFTIMDKMPFSCVGCSGCVSSSSAPSVIVNSGGSGGSCLSSYVSGAWSSCVGSCGTGVRTRTVECRNCNGYISSGCTGSAPITSETCNTGIVCNAGPLIMYSYSTESSSVVKASGATGYRLFTLVPPASYITAVAGNVYTHPMFAVTLQVLSGDADLYLYADFYHNPPVAPAYFPNSDGSLCGCVSGSSAAGGCSNSQYQPTLFKTSCKSGTSTEVFNLNWETVTPFNLHLYVAGWASTSLYTITTVYYYLLRSSYVISVPATAATSSSKQLFQFTSASSASGFVVFATPTTSGVGDPDIYCSFWNFSQFPTSSSSLISAVNVGADTMIVADPSTFATSTSYAIMINSFAAGAYKIEVADIFTLRPGIPSSQMTLEVANAAVYFTIRIPGCDRLSIVLTNTAGDADLYVNDKQFRSGGYGQPCNCAYKSEKTGDDTIHLDWLDSAWSTDLYVSVMSYSTPATFTITAFPMYVMGEAEVYRVSTSFASSTYLLSGEGRTPGSAYDAAGHHVSDISDCEFFGTCTVTLPSSMSTCLYGRRLISENVSTTSPQTLTNDRKLRRGLTFETPESNILMGSSDLFIFGARPELLDQNRVVLEANVMALKIARKYPSCYYSPSVHAYSALPGNFYFGSSTSSTNYVSGTNFKSVSLSKSSHGILVDSPMIASLKLTSAIISSNGQRRILQAPQMENDIKRGPIQQNMNLEGIPYISNRTLGGTVLSLAPVPTFGIFVEKKNEDDSSNYFMSAPLGDVLSNSVIASSQLSLTSHSSLYIEPFSPGVNSMLRERRRLQSGDLRTATIEVLSAPSGSYVGSTVLVSIHDFSNPTSIFSTSSCAGISNSCISISVPASSLNSLISLRVKVPASLIDVSLVVKTLLESTSLPVSTKVKMYSTLSFPSQNGASGRSSVIRTPFSGSTSENLSVLNSESGISKATFSSCETTYTSLNGEAAIYVDISGFSTAGGSIKVEVFVELSTPACPSYFWNSSPWSTCSNSDCSALTGTMTREVWCESSNGDKVSPSSNTCKEDSILSTSSSCSRSNSCVSPTLTTVTGGSKIARIDVMSYTARAIPSGGVFGPVIELPARVSGVWLYNYESNTAWRQSLSTSSISMCLEVSLKPISKYKAGCGYQQLVSIFECQKAAKACLEAQSSGSQRCDCYSAVKSCIFDQMCDAGIKGRGDFFFSLYQSDFSSSKVPSSCVITALSSNDSPVQSYVQGSVIGSWQVLLSSTSASSGSAAVQSWFDPTSKVLSGNLIASASGTAEQVFYIPLQLSRFTSPSPSTLKSITAVLTPTSEFQTKSKISPMRWDNANSLVNGPMILSESDIRTGGSSWIIKVQCDTFLADSFTQSTSADIYNSFVIATFSSDVSQSVEPLGWRGAVIPFLLTNQATNAVSVIDSVSVRVTLPAIPLFRLTSSSETLSINIPGKFLASGQSQKLSATTITITRTSQNCVVGSWTLQGTSPFTNPQFFRLTRTISQNSAGFGDACPSLELTSPILATQRDVYCSFSSCGGRGFCVQNSQGVTSCVCMPGVFGSDCSKIGISDPLISDLTWKESFVSVGSWTSCVPTQCSPSILPSTSIRTTSCLLTGNFDSRCGVSTSALTLPITQSCPLDFSGVAVVIVPLQLSDREWISYFSISGWRVRDALYSEFKDRFSLVLGLSSFDFIRILQIVLTDEKVAVFKIEVSLHGDDIDSLRSKTRSYLIDFLNKIVVTSTSSVTDSAFMNSFGIFKTDMSVLMQYTSATVHSYTDCSISGTQDVDLSSVFPTASPSKLPSPTPTSIFTSTPSTVITSMTSTPSTSSLFIIQSPSPSPRPVVNVALSFEKVRLSLFALESRNLISLVNAVSSAVGSSPVNVAIRRVRDLSNPSFPVVLWTNPQYTSDFSSSRRLIHRRLQTGIGSVSVDFQIKVTTNTAAASLSASLTKSTAKLAADVKQSLINDASPLSLSEISVSVEPYGSGIESPDSSSTFAYWGVVGAVAGVLITSVFGYAFYRIKRRSSAIVPENIPKPTESSGNTTNNWTRASSEPNSVETHSSVVHSTASGVNSQFSVAESSYRMKDVQEEKMAQISVRGVPRQELMTVEEHKLMKEKGIHLPGSVV